MSGGSLFAAPEYLEPLERCGCATPDTGWIAAHIETAADRRLRCYEKSHSWGEFVFDFEFANAYAQHGLEYYPKLVCCVPFTPVPGPRLLAPDDRGRLELAATLIEKTRARGCSSAHILFLPPSEIELLEAGWLRRQQLRYLWRNQGFAGFDDFLAALPGKKRRNIKRERRLIGESGLEISWRAGCELSADEWRVVFGLYAGTYHARGQQPYLNLDCLRAWAQNFRESMLFCLARHHGKLVAMAFFFEDDEVLYGRHWGAAAQYDALHFELCYYQGIARCIERGRRCFDAGVQGEHKLLRGFEPDFTHSAHWFEHAGFRAAIGRFLERESSALRGLARQMQADTP